MWPWFGIDFALPHCRFSDFLVARWQFYENLQTLPLGNVRLFRRIRRNDTLFLKMFFRWNLVNYLENLQILPLGNVRLFRRIRKNDTLFLKMCVVREHLVNLCVFRWNLMNSWETLQIPPLGNVRLFRRIRKNGVPSLKTWVFFSRISRS